MRTNQVRFSRLPTLTVDLQTLGESSEINQGVERASYQPLAADMIDLTN